MAPFIEKNDKRTRKKTAKKQLKSGRSNTKKPFN